MVEVNVDGAQATHHMGAPTEHPRHRLWAWPQDEDRRLALHGATTEPSCPVAAGHVRGHAFGRRAARARARYPARCRGNADRARHLAAISADSVDAH